MASTRPARSRRALGEALPAAGRRAESIITAAAGSAPATEDRHAAALTMGVATVSRAALTLLM